MEKIGLIQFTLRFDWPDWTTTAADWGPDMDDRCVITNYTTQDYKTVHLTERSIYDFLILKHVAVKKSVMHKDVKEDVPGEPNVHAARRV